jgi:hypothetical protein
MCSEVNPNQPYLFNLAKYFENTKQNDFSDFVENLELSSRNTDVLFDYQVRNLESYEISVYTTTSTHSQLSNNPIAPLGEKELTTIKQKAYDWPFFTLKVMDGIIINSDCDFFNEMKNKATNEKIVLARFEINKEY